MTTQQVLALAVISAFVIGLFAYAYWFGRQEGRTRGMLESDRIHHATIKDLEHSLAVLRRDHQNATARAEKLKDASALQRQHRRSMLEIAETLRIAAETWKAFNTGNKLERDARRLRVESLAIAALLKPTEDEAAA